MEKNKEFSFLSSLFVETEYRVVNDEDSMKAATEWWEEMREDGHEGFVVKPESYVRRESLERYHECVLGVLALE